VLIKYGVSESWKDLIHKRLTFLDKIKKGIDKEESLRGLAKLPPDYEVANFLKNMDSLPPRRVRDLLSSKLGE